VTPSTNGCCPSTPTPPPDETGAAPPPARPAPKRPPATCWPAPDAGAPKAGLTLLTHRATAMRDWHSSYSTPRTIMTEFTRVDRRKHPPIAGAIPLYDRWPRGTRRRRGQVVKNCGPGRARHPRTKPPRRRLPMRIHMVKPPPRRPRQRSAEDIEPRRARTTLPEAWRPRRFAGPRPGDVPGRAGPGPETELEAA
jgi:hypothetical protein